MEKLNISPKYEERLARLAGMLVTEERFGLKPLAEVIPIHGVGIPPTPERPRAA